MLFTMCNIFSKFRLKSYSDDDCGPGDAITPFRPKVVPSIQLGLGYDVSMRLISNLSFCVILLYVGNEFFKQVNLTLLIN